jgi:hypothetical protein
MGLVGVSSTTPSRRLLPPHLLIAPWEYIVNLQFFNKKYLLGSGISFGDKTSQIVLQFSFTMHGLVFLDIWKSNSSSVNVIPDAKYLKNMTIIIFNNTFQGHI